MKIEKNDDNYVIFIMNNQILSIDFENKEMVKDTLKEFFIKLKKSYLIDFDGFYQVKIYLNKKIGCFFIMNKLDNYDFVKNSADLKIVINNDYPFYFETENYDYISKYKTVYYNLNKYYVNVSLINDNDVIRLSELGNYVYDIDVDKFSVISL